MEAIRNSEAYRDFEEIKAQVNQEPELKAKLQNFRRRNYELQNKEDCTDLFGEMERFEEEYHEMRKNPLIRDFLQYELEIIRVMQRIDLVLAQAVDLDVEDFQDIIKL